MKIWCRILVVRRIWDTIQHSLLWEWATHYLEVLVVFLIVLVQLVEVLGQLLGPLELVHVDVGVGGGVPGVVLRSSAHHYRQHIVSENRHLMKNKTGLLGSVCMFWDWERSWKKHERKQWYDKKMLERDFKHWEILILRDRAHHQDRQILWLLELLTEPKMQVCLSSSLTRGHWQRISPWCSLDSLSSQKPDKIYSLSRASGNSGFGCSGGISDFRTPHKYQHWSGSQLFPGNQEIHQVSMWNYDWLRMSECLMLSYSSEGYSWGCLMYLESSWAYCSRPFLAPQLETNQATFLVLFPA